MARYRIAHGSVRISEADGDQPHGPGEIVELDEEAAARLGDQVLRLPDSTPAPAESGKAKSKA